MAIVVVDGAQLSCNAGNKPSILKIANSSLSTHHAMAHITDNKPDINIGTFGICAELSKKGVATLCAYTPVATWMPGSSTVFMDGKPLLTAPNHLTCIYGGQIHIVDPGTSIINIK